MSWNFELAYCVVEVVDFLVSRRQVVGCDWKLATMGKMHLGIMRPYWRLPTTKDLFWRFRTVGKCCVGIAWVWPLWRWYRMIIYIIESD